MREVVEIPFEFASDDAAMTAAGAIRKAIELGKVTGPRGTAAAAKALGALLRDLGKLVKLMGVVSSRAAVLLTLELHSSLNLPDEEDMGAEDAVTLREKLDGALLDLAVALGAKDPRRPPSPRPQRASGSLPDLAGLRVDAPPLRIDPRGVAPGAGIVAISYAGAFIDADLLHGTLLACVVHGATRIALDLGGVKETTFQVVDTLAKSAVTLKGMGGGLVLFGLDARLRALVGLSRSASALVLAGTQGEALAHLGVASAKG